MFPLLDEMEWAERFAPVENMEIIGRLGRIFLSSDRKVLFCEIENG